MARRLRMFDEKSIYFITGRTMQGRYLLHPIARVRELMGGVVARGLHYYGDVIVFLMTYYLNDNYNVS